MFQDVIVAALFRTFHARVDDALLDRAARDAGAASAIGRLSLLSDAMAAQAVATLRLEANEALLDLGCGRGFLARWLRHAGVVADYVGVDRIPEALGAARAMLADDPRARFVEGDYRTYRAAPVDAVAALEVTGDGAIDAPLLDAIGANLKPGGRFVLTVAALDDRNAPPRAEANAALRARFDRSEIADATPEAAEFAQRFYDAMLAIDAWEPSIAPRIAAQASQVRDAIAAGSFAYAIVTGTR